MCRVFLRLSQAACLACVQVVMSSDEDAFGGWRNVQAASDTMFQGQSQGQDGRPASLKVSGQEAVFL